MKFAALDFETANYSHLSICAASIATLEDGRLTESGPTDALLQIYDESWQLQYDAC